VCLPWREDAFARYLTPNIGLACDLEQELPLYNTDRMHRVDAS